MVAKLRLLRVATAVVVLGGLSLLRPSSSYAGSVNTGCPPVPQFRDEESCMDGSDPLCLYGAGYCESCEYDEYTTHWAMYCIFEG